MANVYSCIGGSLIIQVHLLLVQTVKYKTEYYVSEYFFAGSSCQTTATPGSYWSQPLHVPAKE